MASLDIPRGQAAYKKKGGILTLTDDRAFLTWSPGAGGPAHVRLAINDIVNLQKTPDSAAKVILKVFEKPKAGAADPTAYMFHFTSPADARAEAEAIKDLLSQLLAEVRGADPNLPRPAAAAANAADRGQVNAAGASAAAAFSAAAKPRLKPSSAPPQAVRWFDDQILKANRDLQQAVLRKDDSLGQKYADARQAKPESMPEAAFNAQFWAARVGLLRAHAIEMSQKKGAYNVLSTIKTRTVDNELKLNINVELIQEIFQRHPLVKRLYNENVPKLSEPEFWSRFFLSRLYKRLRGVRETNNDHTDTLFDKYTEADDMAAFGASRITALDKLPHVIDLDGNEGNQGGSRGGNRPDFEMRQRPRQALVATLNHLSEKIMATVAPTDADEDQRRPDGDSDGDREERTAYRELALRDLEPDAPDDRVVLNVRQQSDFSGSQQRQKDGQGGGEGCLPERLDASAALSKWHADLGALFDEGAGGLDLHSSIGVDDDGEDSEGEDDTAGGAKKGANGAGAAKAIATTTTTPSSTARVGSRGTRRRALEQVMEGIKQRRAEMYGDGVDSGGSPMGIPDELAERWFLTNATAVEFMRQFWDALLSGSAARSGGELAYHAEALGRSVARIKALAAEAEAVRERRNDERKAEIRAHFKQTGKRTKWVPCGGGRDAVLALFDPTLASLKKAQGMYK